VAFSAIGLALAVGSTAYGVHESGVQQRAATDAARDQANEQAALMATQQQNQAQQDQDAQAQQQQVQARQRALASGYQNASRTQFTSPLGLPGGASTTRGTLLGI